MPWFWARVHDRTQQLGYLRGGFQQLYDRMADALRDAGGETRFGETVTAVRRDGDGFVVATANGEERFDRVVSTLPTRLTARLVPELPAEWRDAPRVGAGLRRALPHPGARSAADIGLLAERQRPRLPVHGARRAHQLHAGIRLRRSPPRLPGQLPADGRPAHVGLEGVSPRRVPAAPGAPQPGTSTHPG